MDRRLTTQATGTNAYPIYWCVTCKDSGSVLRKTYEPHSPEADSRGRCFLWERCSVCDGVPRLGGEPAPELMTRKELVP